MLHISILKNVIKHSLKYNLNVETEIKNIFLTPEITNNILDKIILDNLSDISISKSTITNNSEYFDEAIKKFWRLVNKNIIFKIVHPITYNYYNIIGNCIVVNDEFINKDVLNLSECNLYNFNIDFVTIFVEGKELLLCAIRSIPETINYIELKEL